MHEWTSPCEPFLIEAITQSASDQEFGYKYGYTDAAAATLDTKTSSKLILKTSQVIRGDVGL